MSLYEQSINHQAMHDRKWEQQARREKKLKTGELKRDR